MINCHYTLLSLVIAITIISGNHQGLSAQPQSLSLKPLISSDDAEQLVSSDAMDLTSLDLDLDDQKIVGIRFPNVTLPQEATILNAYIQFTADEIETQGTNMTIKAQQGNAASYSTTNSDITNRPYTGSSIVWSVPPWSTIGSRTVDQQSPNLSSIITEAMQAGFSPGDALAFSLTVSGSGARTAQPVDVSSSTAAELIIEYTEEPVEPVDPSLLIDVLVLNEITGTGTAQNNNEWVELYNKSNDAINLDSVSVSDKFSEPNKFMFTPTNLNGQGFVLVETGPFFGIKNDGETIYLFQTVNGSTVLLDSLAGRSTIFNTSYGRQPNGSSNIVDFNNSTPGSSNNSAEEFFDVQFNPPRGLYTNAISVTLSAPQGATIRYTTDLSTPSSSSGTVYNGPIQLTDNTVIKAYAYGNNGLSKVVTSTYVINNDIRYQEIPFVCFTTANDLASTTERECSVEYIDKFGEGSSAFADAGFYIFGAQSVNEDKRNFRFKFRAQYGYSSFSHPIFEKKDIENYKPVKRFNSFDLKSGQDATETFGLGGTNMSENIAHNYFREMGNIDPHTRHVHAFINGNYHGIYTLREHFSTSYAEDYFGGDKDDYDHMSGTRVSDSWMNNPEIASGSVDAWNTLKSYAENDFQEVKARLDVDQFIDYMLLHFIGDYEWEYRAMADKGFDQTKFRFHVNDFDGFIRNNPRGNSSYEGKLNTTSGVGPGNLFYLAGFGGSNLEYMTRVKDRVLILYDENNPKGVITERNFREKTNAFREGYRKYNQLEYDRWGYTDSDEFEERVDGYLNYLPTRFATVRAFLDDRDLLHTLDYVTMSRPAGNLVADQTVTLSNPNSGTTVYYTLDGRDVVFDDGIAPWAIAYSPEQALPLVDGLNTVKARAYSNDNFGPLTEVNYTVVEGINITGVGYNIQANDNLDFLFVSNFNTQSIQVGGDSITAAISFAFPAGTSIAAGETVMITKELSKYPDITMTKFLWTTGKLSNDGEQIIYKTAAGDVINDFTYNDKLPWPEEADGEGSYLQLKSDNLDNTIADNWEALDISTLGRTTQVDPVVFQNYGINITGLAYNVKDINGAGDDNLEFLFITNFGTQNRLVAGDSISKGITFEFPAGTTLAAGETVMLSRDITKYPDVTLRKFEWDTGRFSNNGEQVIYKNAAGDIINDFTYLDTIPWPVGADGDGAFISLITDNVDNSIASNWEAVDLATLGRSSAIDPQVFENYGINITGVGYHILNESGIADDSLDFLFVTNFGTQNKLVAGDSIYQGIKFAFPAGTIIAAGETVMITKDVSKYPEVQMTKYLWQVGSLSNGGEQIGYKNTAGDIINDFSYNDVLPWPVEADGAGFYLQLIADNLDNRIPQNWEAIPVSTLGSLSCLDSDGDGVCDEDDQCAGVDDSLIGQACSDGDVCTIGETYDATCACIGGVFQDADSDGVCDTEDQCPTNNDNLIGQSCDDGDVCTVGETYDSTCQCSGGLILDSDNDGLCDALDDCDLIDLEDFESDAGMWQPANSDISDAFRIQSTQSPSGNYSFLIRDNSGDLSSVFSSVIDFTGLGSAEISFSFRSISLSAGEDFFLDMSTDGGSSFQVIRQWVNGIDFNNNVVYTELVDIAEEDLSNNVVFKFRCDGGINSDQVFLDDIKIESCPSSTACQATIVQSGNAMITKSQYAQNSISSDGIVMSGTTIEFVAGNSIQMISNFEVQVGAVYHAYIDVNHCGE